MIGYSQGARVAYGVAAAHPDRLAGLVGLGHLQAFWRADLALPPIKRFLATLSTTAGS